MENQNSSDISKHKIVAAEEWRKERLALLEEEKQLTHQSDAVAGKRQNLPWVKVDKEYMFETEDGKVPFADLFKGRSQLMVYHFMFGAEYDAGCPHCSAIADGFNGIWQHLANHDVMLWAISLAPFEKLNAYKQRMCWSFPWASSANSDFNYDYNASFSEEQRRTGNLEYNYNNENVSSKKNDVKQTDEVPEFGKQIAATVGTDWATYTKQAPGMSTFVLKDGIIYHTYSAYARGLDGMWNIYQWLDRAPLGRNESGLWMKRHDEYENIPQINTGSKSCCD